MKKVREAKGRKVLQWFMAPLAPLVIVGGYRWPYLGYIAIAFMLLMFIMVWFRGRYYCGWLCAMGAFHERILARISLNRKMLPLFTTSWFKWLVFTLMMALLLSRLIMSGGDPEQIGAVFVMMWTISTGLAIGLGLIWKPRSWCSFCPMATMQAIMAPKVYRIEVSDACKQCGLCQRVCPIETYPGAFKAAGAVDGALCMRCMNCVESCSKKALTLGKETVLSGSRGNTLLPHI